MTGYRYTRGHSERGKQPGSRTWESHSIYMNPWSLLFGYGIWWTFLLIFVLPLWLGIEMYILFVCSILLLCQWIFNPPTRFQGQFQRLWVFWFLTT